MKGKKKTVIYIAALVILISLVGSLFLEDGIGSRIATVITVITAIIGAVALFVQFKRDKDLNEASFLVDYSVQFYNTYNCSEILNELETSRKDPDYKIDIDKYYKDIVGYLEWVESLAALVNAGTLSLDKIDDVLSYRYFIIVNNKQIQDAEIIPCRMYYRGLYTLYENWVSYKRKKGLYVTLEQTELSKSEHYDEMVPKKKG